MTAPAPVASTSNQRLTAAKLAQVAALVQAQATVREQLTRAAVAAAVAPLRTFTAWWDADAVSKMIAQVLRVVQPTQLRAARVTDAFAAQVMTVMTGRRVRPRGAVDITKLRRAIPPRAAQDLVAGRRVPPFLELGGFPDGPNGDINRPVDMSIRDDERSFVDPAEPYGRVADSYRYNVVARGDSEEAAARKAVTRISAAAWTDVTLAVREQYQASFDDERIVAWRRVLLGTRQTGGPPCGLCVVAADRIYRRKDLMPIHSRCRCGVLPILDGMDPGLRLNQDDLTALYNAAGGTGAGGLLNVKVALTEHGELGPVLVNADQRRRGPVEAARTQVPDRRVRARAQLDSLEESLASLEARAARGDIPDDYPALVWQQNKVTDLRAELARLGG